jgi:hypothetical protein
MTFAKEYDDLIDDTELDQAPKIFPRILTSPPGLPWDQSRAAMLDARLNAPMPIGELVVQLRRLSPWRPGEAGRFVAFYARRVDIEGGLVESVLVDGAAFLVRFETEAAQAARRLLVIGIAGAIGVTAALLFTGVSLALANREDAQMQMTRLEAEITARNHALNARNRDLAEARNIDNADLTGRDLDHLLTDLAWTDAAKAPDLRLLGWFWDKGYMAVEVRSPAPFPSADRPVRRNDKPTRQGVWLYGISPATAPRAGR